MPEDLKFPFPLPVLLKEGELLLDAGDKYSAKVAPRLPNNFLADTRALGPAIVALDEAQKSQAGDAGTLTKEQDDALKKLQPKLGAARDTARRAFKGNDVKLHEEFQIGVAKPNDLGSVVQRARLTLAGMRKAENLPALKMQGWLPADAEELESLITALADTDNTQENAKSLASGGTTARNVKANAYYDALLTLQNAANLAYPDGDATNYAIRDEFRLGKFPPRGGGGKKPEPPKPPTPPA